MKNRTVVAPKATVGMKDAARTWLSSDNKLFTALMERRVTNRQMLLLCHAMVPFSLLAAGTFGSLAMFFLVLGWFGAAVLLCKKGGC